MTHPAQEPLSQKSSEASRLVDVLVSDDRTPLLHALLTGEQGSTIRAELEQVFKHFVGDRAPREKVKVLAKLLRSTKTGDLEEPVIVRDISESGAQLAVSARTGLKATDLATVKLRLRVEGVDEDVVVQAQLARILRSDDHFVHIGVKFLDLPLASAAALHRLVHATTVAPGRRSTTPPMG
jgi:hypothetical protein